MSYNIRNKKTGKFIADMNLRDDYAIIGDKVYHCKMLRSQDLKFPQLGMLEQDLEVVFNETKIADKESTEKINRLVDDKQFLSNHISLIESEYKKLDLECKNKDLKIEDLTKKFQEAKKGEIHEIFRTAENISSKLEDLKKINQEKSNYISNNEINNLNMNKTHLENECKTRGLKIADLIEENSRMTQKVKIYADKLQMTMNENAKLIDKIEKTSDFERTVESLQSRLNEQVKTNLALVSERTTNYSEIKNQCNERIKRLKARLAKNWLEKRNLQDEFAKRMQKLDNEIREMKENNEINGVGSMSFVLKNENKKLNIIIDSLKSEIEQYKRINKNNTVQVEEFPNVIGKDLLSSDESIKEGRKILEKLNNMNTVYSENQDLKNRNERQKETIGGFIEEIQKLKNDNEIIAKNRDHFRDSYHSRFHEIEELKKTKINLEWAEKMRDLLKEREDLIEKLKQDIKQYEFRNPELLEQKQ